MSFIAELKINQKYIQTFLKELDPESFTFRCPLVDVLWIWPSSMESLELTSLWSKAQLTAS